MASTSDFLLRAEPPLVAILRGIVPDEVEAVGMALVEAGIVLIEIPINRPFAFECLRRLVHTLPPHVHVGGGTVVNLEEVDQVRQAGGHMVLAPHCDPGVIAHARASGLGCVPGIFTPTEAFQAVRHGAHALKVFPAECLGPAGISALRAVLPRGTPLWPVTGVTPHNLGTWVDAGATGFGIGPALYRPGMTPTDVAASAGAFVAAWRERSLR